jgi:hypothetical protein
MASPRPSNIPPVWENQDIVLYHGTTKTNAELIQANGIDLAEASPKSDFGRGFYTTTSLRQAKNWAWRQADRLRDVPSVLSYTISREEISRLDTLWFVNGNHDAEDFWAFVFHCRQGNPGHGRSGTMLYYDCVVGPVAAFWFDREPILNADQISFHTEKGLTILRRAKVIEGAK